LCLKYVIVYIDIELMDDPTSTSNNKKAIIITLVVGGILILVIIALAVWYYSSKTPTGPYSNIPPSSSNNSSPGAAPAGPTCPYYSGMPDKDIKGFDMDDGYFEQQTLSNCQKLCDDNKCQWLTYDNDSFECWLKQGVDNNDVTTGLRIQSAIDLGCPTYTYLNKTDISGSDTFASPYSVPTLDECQNLCDTNDCDWFTFNESEAKCWLKKADNNNNKYTSFRTDQ
jgi:hypothetical protein